MANFTWIFRVIHGFSLDVLDPILLATCGRVGCRQGKVSRVVALWFVLSIDLYSHLFPFHGKARFGWRMSALRRHDSPQLYIGQHWPSCGIFWHPGLFLHCVIVQANPGGWHWHSSQGLTVGSRCPIVYSTPSTAHTSKKTVPLA